VRETGTAQTRKKDDRSSSIRSGSSPESKSDLTAPRWRNAHADVEAVHLITEEVSDLEQLSASVDFRGTAMLYQHSFNFAPPHGRSGGARGRS
jgi:hypothetical protein